MITSLARINGKPVGVIANSTKYLSGAIDGDASDKASRFMQLCDAFNFPIISFCDTPDLCKMSWTASCNLGSRARQ